MKEYLIQFKEEKYKKGMLLGISNFLMVVKILKFNALSYKVRTPHRPQKSISFEMLFLFLIIFFHFFYCVNHSLGSFEFFCFLSFPQIEIGE